jgi:hypothetical protein
MTVLFQCRNETDVHHQRSEGSIWHRYVGPMTAVLSLIHRLATIICSSKVFETAIFLTSLQIVIVADSIQ